MVSVSASYVDGVQSRSLDLRGDSTSVANNGDLSLVSVAFSSLRLRVCVPRIYVPTSPSLLFGDGVENVVPCS